jgi:hypothetical protein
MLAASAFILLLAISLSHPVWGYDDTIVFSKDHFHVTWNINSWQNLTALAGPLYPGNLSISLTGQDYAAFSSALQDALQKEVPSASISQLTAHIFSSGTNSFCTQYSCPIQWLNATIGFDLAENPVRVAGSARYDMSWKTLRIENDLSVAGSPFNRLGERYLISGLLPYLNFPRSSTSQMAVQVDGVGVTAATYQAPTTNLVLLDFSGFPASLDTWNNTRNILTYSQTWTSPVVSGFRVIAEQRLPEGSILYFFIDKISAQVSAPLNALVKSDTLFVDTTNGLWDKASLAIVLGILGTLFSATILERRTISRTWTSRRSRKER